MAMTQVSRDQWVVAVSFSGGQAQVSLGILVDLKAFFQAMKSKPCRTSMTAYLPTLRRCVLWRRPMLTLRSKSGIGMQSRSLPAPSALTMTTTSSLRPLMT
uniref:Uncharacterized protein n=1 Tax=Ailuropoda melanoleuca TaxID=9646 RepID=A0A7N5K0U8_AILME